MTPIKGTIHPEFRLWGAAFTERAVVDAGYSMIKEGEPYEKDIGDFIMDWVSDLPYITMETSGTTGVPTRVKVKKEAMVKSALATGEYFDLQPGDRCLMCLPAGYIAGKMMLVRALVLGMDLYLVPPSSSPMDSTHRSFDFCAMIPMQLQNSLSHLDRISKLIVGGAPLSPDLEKKIPVSKCTIYETFGMTETLSHIAVRTVSLARQKADPDKENYFEALPGVYFKTDKRGCLVINATHIQKDPIVTNDEVSLISDTKFKWLGRIDNVVYSGGVKLYPEIIEKKLQPYIQSRYFLAGIPDDILGEKLILFVEGKIDAKSVIAQLKGLQELNPYEIPKEIVSISKFEETGSGKIQRQHIVSRYKS